MYYVLFLANKIKDTSNFNRNSRTRPTRTEFDPNFDPEGQPDSTQLNFGT